MMKLLIFVTIFCAAHESVIGFYKPKQNTGLWNTLDKQPPVLAAHRGEKILMPEHTAGAYEIAAIEGADYVEPDLVLTRDGHLVCSHNLTLGTETNAADFPEFADRKGSIFIDYGGGFNTTITDNWFFHNFTLAELKQLRMRQIVRGRRPQYFNNQFQILTFTEYLGIIHKMIYLQNRTIGVIPELKESKFHNSLPQFDGEYYMEDLLLNVFRDNGYAIRQGDVSKCNYTTNNNVYDIECGRPIIQSFEMGCIEYLHTKTDIDLLKLVSTLNYEELTYQGIKKVAAVAQHFHIGKELLYTGIEAALRRANRVYDEEHIASLGGFVPPADIVKESHAVNLRVGVYTIVDSYENSNRGCDVQCEPNDKEKEMFFFFDMGVDAFFVENVHEAVILRLKFGHQLEVKQLTTFCE